VGIAGGGGSRSDVAAGEGAPAWTSLGVWRGWWAGVLLVVLCLSVYLPGFRGIPAVDRDESRFAQASRQMLESGDWIVPRVQDRARLNKPPLIYWLQAGSAKALTGGDVGKDAVWMYRVPSLLAAVGVVLVTWRLGASMFGGFVGFLGAVIVGVCPVFWWEARQARADMVLVLATVVGALALWKCWRGFVDDGRARIGWTMLLWGAVAAGVMTKGPMTPVVLGLGVVALCASTGRWRFVWALRPWLGLVVVFGAVGPWVWMVAREVGWTEYLRTVSEEVLGRSIEPKEGHGGFPGYHTLLLPLLLFPGSVLVGVAVWNAVREWRHGSREKSAPVFLLCLIVPAWMVMELVGTKLPHYTMAVFPFLTLLTARACCVGAEGLHALMRAAVVRWAMTLWLVAVPVFVLVGTAVLAVTLPRVAGIGVIIAGVGVVVAFVGVSVWGLRLGDMPLLQCAAAGAYLCAAVALGFAGPRLEFLWISRRAGAMLRHLDPGEHVAIAAVGSDSERGIVGFHEDSLVFETRGRIERITPGELDAWFAKHPDGLAVVPLEMLVGQTPYMPVARIDGFNYSKGRLTYLCVAGVRP
jgi:4-amino-4-deoxy-L-arabinose transferase-like glycosyltransferase